MREIFLDTETSGASARNGDRIVEIGMVEMVDGRTTGRVFHEFLDPMRPVHFAAHKVHGLGEKALKGQPCFSDVAPAILAFIGGDPVLIQNVKFDKAFLNGELIACGRRPLPDLQFVETMEIFRRHFRDGRGVRLDDMARDLGVRTPDRTVHGALLDAAILAAAVSVTRGGPDVDVAALVAAGNEGRVVRDRVTGWGPRREARPQQASPRQPDESVARVSRADVPDARSQTARDLVDRLGEAWSGASDFGDFLAALEDREIRVRPNIAGTGKLYGLRFRFRDVFVLAGSVGLKSSDLEKGPLAYCERSHKAVAMRFRDAYERDFGLVVAETNTKLEAEDFPVRFRPERQAHEPLPEP